MEHQKWSDKSIKATNFLRNDFPEKSTFTNQIAVIPQFKDTRENWNV